MSGGRHVVVALLVLLAGCSGLPGGLSTSDGGSAETPGTAGSPTPTPAPTPTGTPAPGPPGATDSGLNATRLVDAHVGTLADSGGFATRLTGQVAPHWSGSDDTGYEVRTRWTADWRTTTRRTGAGRFRDRYATSTANGTLVYARHGVDDVVRYHRVPSGVGTLPAGPEAYAQADLLRALVQAGLFTRNGTTGAGDDRTVRYRATVFADEEAADQLVDDANGRLADATLRVRQDGLVTAAGYTVEYPGENRSRRVDFEVTTTGEVTRPDWVATARTEALVLDRTFGTDRSFVAYRVEQGSIPANATAGLDLAPGCATVPERVEPGETLYVTSSGNTTVVSVDRTPPEGSVGVQSTFELAVGGTRAYRDVVPGTVSAERRQYDPSCSTG